MKNSIKNVSSYRDTINSIKLNLHHPQGKNKIWVIVEGDTDQRFYKKFLSHPDVSIEQSFSGCEKIETIIDEIRQLTDRIIGIKDADFAILLNFGSLPPNIFLTDEHDIEMMMVKSDKTFKSLLIEKLFEECESFSEIRNKVLNLIQYLGIVRLFNQQNSIQLNFQGINYGVFINLSSMTTDKNALIAEMNQRSANKTRLISHTDVDPVESMDYDPYQLCNGHDFICVLALYIKYKTGTGIKHEHLCSQLRSTYTLNEFKKTQLSQKLINWETTMNLHLFEAHA